MRQDAFLDELIVWRELSVNFVRYQPEYDSIACADNWARLTIAKHDRDEREVLYTLKQMEEARTHDELWNAAQLQMVHYGWMHNYLRMYWAKKILEWTRECGDGDEAGDLSERPLFSGWARSERICGHRVGDSGEV